MYRREKSSIWVFDQSLPYTVLGEILFSPALHKLMKAWNCLNITKWGALGCKEAKYLGEGRGKFKEPRNLYIPKENSLCQTQ